MVAIEIPIGLPDEGRRNADVLAKCMAGEGISAQAYALRARLVVCRA